MRGRLFCATDGKLPARPEFTDPYLPPVECKIEKADKYTNDRQNHCRYVRIDELVQVVEQKAALVRRDARRGFEPVLKHSQRTRPRKQFRKNSPEQRSDMQPAKNGAGTCQQSSEDDPQYERRMYDEDADCQF